MIIEKRKLKIEYSIDAMEPLLKLSWIAAMFGYFFQFPLGSKYSSLIVPFIGIYLILNFLQNRTIETRKDWMQLYLFFVFCLFVSAFISVFKGVEFGNVVRFLLILVIIPITTLVDRRNFNFEFDVFVLFAIAKCFILFYYGINMMRTGSYFVYRNWAYANHFGDIYISPVTHLPCVQVMGNALIPMAFVLNDMYSKSKPIIKNIISGIFLLGTLTAGNAAFLICVALYVFYRLINKIFHSNKSTIKKALLAIVLFILIILFSIASILIMEQKATWSNAVRGAQARILLSGNFVIGNGLANPIYGFAVDRTYNGTNIYFELQTLYIVNQIGIFGIMIFYLLMYLGLQKYGKRVLILFLIYLLYTFWNPYCFDTTEMIMVIMLVNLDKNKELLIE